MIDKLYVGLVNCVDVHFLHYPVICCERKGFQDLIYGGGIWQERPEEGRHKFRMENLPSKGHALIYQVLDQEVLQYVSVLLMLCIVCNNSIE